MKWKTMDVETKPAVRERFHEMFRGEHRQLQDALLALVQAFQTRDKLRIQALLDKLIFCAGPHFRYEEEALYPVLFEFSREECVRKLFAAHDDVIAVVRELVTIAEKELTTAAGVLWAIHGIGSILSRIGDCDGLSMMLEYLPENRIQTILESRDKSRRAGLDLLTWARKTRTAGKRFSEPVLAAG